MNRTLGLVGVLVGMGLPLGAVAGLVQDQAPPVSVPT